MNGRRILGEKCLLPGVAQMLSDIYIEGTFADGTKVVHLETPVCADYGNFELAFYGSFLPIPKQELFDVILRILILLLMAVK